jgi:uncharacterized protein (TIGR02453 family)
MFAGFPPETLKFLRSLKRNNRREWFQPRKELFEAQVRQPMLDLVEALNAELLRFAPHHINDPKKAVYRIYRDTRFSHDKTPYKTHLACVFPARGLSRDTSGVFYFHVSPEESGLAVGCYMPGPPQARAIRTWIAANHDKFRKAAKAAEKSMGKMHGEGLARMPKGFDAAHPAADLLRRKSWMYCYPLDAKLVESPKLLPEIVKRFRAATPFVEMLNSALR